MKLRLSGVTLKETAERCCLSRTTVVAACKAYEAGGELALTVERPGRPPGSGRLVTQEQALEIQSLVRTHTPDALGLKGSLWDRELLAALIQERYGVMPSLRVLLRHMASWGFKADSKQPGQVLDLVGAHYFWERDLPDFRRAARRLGAMVTWLEDVPLPDISAPECESKGRLNRSKRSHRMKGRGQRMIYVTTARGDIRWLVFGGDLSTRVIGQFLERLVTVGPRPAYVFYGYRKAHLRRSAVARMHSFGARLTVEMAPARLSIGEAARRVGRILT
ncbi:MAG: helix-turn-helix domain-containing protein [Burkholderiales bacterium]|nr:helix-turn-helix domain-containing protein [Burkholderiales bacterium]